MKIYFLLEKNLKENFYFGLLMIEMNVYELIKGIKEDSKSKLVRLVPEKGFDVSVKHHPLENYLAREGIPYYFNGDDIESSEDYEINLNKLKVIYPNNSLPRA